MNIMKIHILTIFLCIIPFLAMGQPFKLTDSDPKSDEFKKRFFASYGVHSEIEPTLNQKDRPFYQKVFPFLESDPKKAITIIEEEMRPDKNAAFDFLIGNLYYALEDYVLAEKNLKIALRKFPDFRRAWRTLALCLVQQERFKESIESWLKVIGLGGGDAQSYGLLAYAHLIEEKYHSALKAYGMARMFKPDSLDYKRGEAQCLLMMERYPDAISLYDELIEENPSIRDFWLFQVNAYIAIENHASAISNLEVIRSMQLVDWSHLNLLGNLYLISENYNLALQTYQESLFFAKKEDFNKLLEPMRNFVNASCFQEAYLYFIELRKLTKQPIPIRDQVELDILLARIQLQSEQYGDAVLTLKNVIEKDPLNGVALILLGEHAMKTENFARANIYFERASTMDDFKVDAWIQLGRLNVQQSNFKRALDYLNKANRLKPTQQLEDYIGKIKSILSRM